MSRFLTPRTALRLLPVALPAKPAATATPHEQLVEYIDRWIARAVLGSTLTTDAPTSPFEAEMAIHEQVRRQMLTTRSA